ncbi:MAG TPA: hypothetical protein VET90_10350 [Candidatus Binatus sp.]|nr:hypothetical protein [Candidatus Binatus sp.]
MGSNPTGPSAEVLEQGAMTTNTSGWETLLGEAEGALRRARRAASEGQPGSADQAAAASLVVRLPEFIRDVRLAERRGRTNLSAYRSVFEQLVPSLPRDP